MTHIRSRRLNATISFWKGWEPWATHFAGSGFFFPRELTHAASVDSFTPTLVVGNAASWLLHLFPHREWQMNGLRNSTAVWRAYGSHVQGFLDETRFSFGADTVITWSSASGICAEHFYVKPNTSAVARWWSKHAGDPTNTRRTPPGGVRTPLDECTAHTLAQMRGLPERRRLHESTDAPPAPRPRTEDKDDAAHEAATVCSLASFTQAGIDTLNTRARAAMRSAQERRRDPNVFLLDSALLTRGKCTFTAVGDGRHFPALDFVRIRVLMNIVESARAARRGGRMWEGVGPRPSIKGGRQRQA